MFKNIEKHKAKMNGNYVSSIANGKSKAIKFSAVWILNICCFALIMLYLINYTNIFFGEADETQSSNIKIIDFSNSSAGALGSAKLNLDIENVTVVDNKLSLIVSGKNNTSDKITLNTDDFILVSNNTVAHEPRYKRYAMQNRAYSVEAGEWFEYSLSFPFENIDAHNLESYIYSLNVFSTSDRYSIEFFIDDYTL